MGKRDLTFFILRHLGKHNKEKMNDKSHPVKFKGEATELETLSTWLVGLKAGK